MRYLSLFSGVEAATQAWHPLGWECVGVSEIEPFPCSLLGQHYPRVPNLGDVTKIDETTIALLGPIDLIVFGSPCQDLSVAGKRKGFTNEDGNATRSGLFHTAIDIIEWAREHCGLRWALWENVPGAFSSSQGRDFAVVVAELAGLEHVDVPKNGWGNEGCAVGEHGLVEWSTLDAQWFGVAQRRRRCFALADFGDWSGRQPILLEPHGLRRDTAPRREAGQSTAHATAPCLTSSGKGFERAGDIRGQDPVVAVGLQRPGVVPPISHCLNAGSMGRIDFETETLVPRVAHALRAEGFDASEDGTGRGTPLVPVLPFDTTQITNADNGSNPSYGDPCHPLARGAHAPAIAYGFQQRIARNGRGDMGDVVSALSAQAGETGKGDAAPCVAVGYTIHGTDGTISVASLTEVAGSIRTKPPGSIENSSTTVALSGMQVRRLTPVECERLQGMADGYTNVTYRGKRAADGPRYEALGNSMAVPVMRWIGVQLDLVGLFQ